jgi:hypothetical protein
MTGRLIGAHHLEGDGVSGQKSIEIKRKGLAPGLYLYKIKSSTDKIWSGRLIVR